MTTDPTSHIVRLMTWLSPSFPVGAYSYSHGIEYAIEAGAVSDRDALAAWVTHLLRYGTGRTDGILCRAAYDAVEHDDADAFADAAAWSDVLRATPEMALESTAQGAAFAETVTAAWPALELAPWRSVLDAVGRPMTYPLAVGTVAALAGIPLAPALAAYLHAFAANLVSAGVRIIPLGQTDGQKATAVLEAIVLEVAEAIAARPQISLPEDLGAAAPLADWASTKHETQYTRLFRS